MWEESKFSVFRRAVGGSGRDRPSVATTDDRAWALLGEPPTPKAAFTRLSAPVMATSTKLSLGYTRCCSVLTRASAPLIFFWWVTYNVHRIETLDDAKLIYCPYTDRDIRVEDSSLEHIIPLALGGANGLEVRVDAGYNSALGSELDGKLANEFLMAIRRTEYDARGHSGKEPWATIKQASYGDDARPAQVHLHRRHGLKVWDARDREEKRGVGEVRISTTLNIDLPVQFTAKVGLAAGHLFYRDLFREHVDHHQLRKVMLIDPATLEGPDSMGQVAADEVIARVDNCLYEPPSKRDWRLLVLRRFCSEVEGSVVVLVPGRDCFQVTVGILGQFIGTINVPANTNLFPNEGDFHWGHVVSVVKGKIERRSWFDCMQRWVGDLMRA